MRNTEKEVYQRPEMEIIRWESCDVIVTSRDTDFDVFSEEKN